MGVQARHHGGSEGLEAWLMDEPEEGQPPPHRLDPTRRVSQEQLSGLGILYWHLRSADDHEHDPELQRIREERGYSYQDVIDVSPDGLPDYNQKLKTFYEEHIHTDEEIRCVLDGSGYFDVRDFGDRWIRIWTKKGDMIVLPAGIYHRFSVDENNYIKVLRLFIGEPVWTPYNRPQDEHPIRKHYVHQFKKNV